MEAIDLDTEFNFGRILAMKRLHDSYHALSERLEEMSQPILSDWNTIPELYELFKRVFANRPQNNQVYQRQKFLFTILYLFCPDVLVEEKMPRGLRPILARIFHLKSGTPISDNCSGLLILYKTYIDFPRDVEIFYNAVMDYIPHDDL